MRDKESKGFGFWGIVAVGLVGALIHSNRERSEEERRRKNTPCKFSDGITKAQFEDIVNSSRKGIKRLTGLSAIGSVVYGTVRSNSGLSHWAFRIDFNDYGRITGQYWLNTQNHDSSIPKTVAETISGAIKILLNNNSPYNLDGTKKNRAEIKNIKRRKREEFKREFIKTLIVSVLCLALIIAFLLWFVDNEEKKEIRTGISSSYAVGRDYEDIIEELEDNGFTNVVASPEYNLTKKDERLENKVSRIEIQGESEFSANSRFAYDSDVIVFYHLRQDVYSPLSAKKSQKNEL